MLLKPCPALSNNSAQISAGRGMGGSDNHRPDRMWECRGRDHALDRRRHRSTVCVSGSGIHPKLEYPIGHSRGCGCCQLQLPHVHREECNHHRQLRPSGSTLTAVAGPMPWSDQNMRREVSSMLDLNPCNQNGQSQKRMCFSTAK